MKCPSCSGPTKVADTSEAGKLIKRRRKCQACGLIYRTMEVPITGHGNSDQQQRQVKRLERIADEFQAPEKKTYLRKTVD